MIDKLDMTLSELQEKFYQLNGRIYLNTSDPVTAQATRVSSKIRIEQERRFPSPAPEKKPDIVE